MTPEVLIEQLFTDYGTSLTVLGTQESNKEASDKEFEWRVLGRLPLPIVGSPNALLG